MGPAILTRVLVCGGRWWNNQHYVDEVLDRLHAEYHFTLLIQGGQRTIRHRRGEPFGADYQAKRWAENRGVPGVEEKADWASYPKAGGVIRNTVMLRKHKPQLGVAFKGGNGTKDMTDKLWKAGVKVLEFGREL